MTSFPVLGLSAISRELFVVYTSGGHHRHPRRKLGKAGIQMTIRRHEVISGIWSFGDISRIIRRRNFRLPPSESSSKTGSDRIGPHSFRVGIFFAMASFILRNFRCSVFRQYLENYSSHRLPVDTIGILVDFRVRLPFRFHFSKMSLCERFHLSVRRITEKVTDGF